MSDDKTMRLLAALQAIAGLKTLPQPTAGELLAFEARCRKVDVLELGDLLFNARTAAHRKVAERVASERLAQNDLHEHKD